MEFLKAIFQSKKAGAAIAAAVVAFLTTLGLDEEIATLVVQALMAYIGAQGLADLGLAIKGSKKA